MSIQKILIEEKTMLQHNGEKVGVIVDRTPKCHLEMEDEEIKCASAANKLHFRRLSMALKRRKEKFINSIHLSINTDSALTLERFRKFYKRTRRCIVNYKIIDNELNFTAEQFFFSLFKKMSVERKIHMNAMNFQARE